MKILTGIVIIRKAGIGMHKSWMDTWCGELCSPSTISFSGVVSFQMPGIGEHRGEGWIVGNKICFIVFFFSYVRSLTGRI